MRSASARCLQSLWVAGLFSACSGVAASAPLAISVRARAVAPGEPLRIVACAAQPLARLSGRFGEEPLAFAPSSADGGCWSAWAIVPLDAEQGLRALELQGITASGIEARGTRAVRIEPREFPVEELKVAPRYVTPPPEVARRLEEERRLLQEIYGRRSPWSAPGPFARPVRGEPTSVFGTRRVFNGEPRAPHPGLDLRVAEGTPVHAAGEGEVALARELYYSGNTVILDHGGGLFTVYAHLSRIEVREGRRVAQGARLGLSGATGRVTGPHLHWGAKIGEGPFDPTALLDPALFED